MRKNGSEFEPFIPLVASGYNTSMFERVATEKIIQSGEMVILDIGAVVSGYTGDLGRTVICGEPTRRAEGDLSGDPSGAAGSQEDRSGPASPATRSTSARARSSRTPAGADYLYTGNTGHQLGYRPARRAAGAPQRRLRGRREHGDVPRAADRAAGPAGYRRRASRGRRASSRPTAPSSSTIRPTTSACLV